MDPIKEYLKQHVANSLANVPWDLAAQLLPHCCQIA